MFRDLGFVARFLASDVPLLVHFGILIGALIGLRIRAFKPYFEFGQSQISVFFFDTISTYSTDDASRFASLTIGTEFMFLFNFHNLSEEQPPLDMPMMGDWLPCCECALTSFSKPQI
jgi:hypothetical protein